MASQNPNLAQLRDIHMPDVIGYWPLAPGFYLLGVLVCIAILVTGFLLIRYFMNGRGKRKALRVLEDYQNDYLNHKNSQLSSAQLSELLKRVALIYYPREQVASLQGDAWIEFLNQSSRNIDFKTVRSLLIECPFQPPQTRDLLPLFKLTGLWIKQRRGRCLN